MFVPGSLSEILGAGPSNHPFSWHAVVREKYGAKKQLNYWTNGSEPNKEAVATRLARDYPNIDVISVERATKMPERPLFPVPAHHFQNPRIILLPDGTAAARDEIQDPTLTRPQPLAARPLISLQPLSSRRSLCLPLH